MLNTRKDDYFQRRRESRIYFPEVLYHRAQENTASSFYDAPQRTRGSASITSCYCTPKRIKAGLKRKVGESRSIELFPISSRGTSYTWCFLATMLSSFPRLPTRPRHCPSLTCWRWCYYPEIFAFTDYILRSMHFCVLVFLPYFSMTRVIYVVQHTTLDSVGNVLIKTGIVMLVRLMVQLVHNLSPSILCL